MGEKVARVSFVGADGQVLFEEYFSSHSDNNDGKDILHFIFEQELSFDDDVTVEIKHFYNDNN